MRETRPALKTFTKNRILNQMVYITGNDLIFKNRTSVELASKQRRGVPFGLYLIERSTETALGEGKSSKEIAAKAMPSLREILA